MPAIATTDDFVAALRKSRLLTDAEVNTFLASHPELTAATPLASAMKVAGLLTDFQAGQLLRGRHKGFLLGKYKLLDRIGLGGMGQVYLAEHTSMRRRVAVKVLPPDRSDNPFARERFLREARAAAAVEHPNLCRVYDIEQDGDVHFLVMEYIDGVSLHDLVSRRGKLSPERVANYLYHVAAGLSALHERSLVHRDIKPANLLLDRGGVVRILDLGLVRSELDDDALTKGEGAKIVGTADFLAPEQAIDCSKVDARADIYGLGSTAYFLLTGQPPFVTEKVSQKLLAHQLEPVKPFSVHRPDVPEELAQIIYKMLGKKPADRHQSAIELMVALEPWASVPLPPPDEADFPDRAGWATPSSQAMSFAGRTNSAVGSAIGSAVGSRLLGTHSKPIMRGETTGGSVVRIGGNPGSPPSGGLGGQVTKASAAEETAKHPKQPVVQPVAAKDGTAAIAALFGTTTPTTAKPAAGSNLGAAIAAAIGLAAAAAAGMWLAMK